MPVMDLSVACVGGWGHFGSVPVLCSVLLCRRSPHVSSPAVERQSFKGQQMETSKSKMVMTLNWLQDNTDVLSQLCVVGCGYRDATVAK